MLVKNLIYPLSTKLKKIELAQQKRDPIFGNSRIQKRKTKPLPDPDPENLTDSSEKRTLTSPLNPKAVVVLFVKRKGILREIVQTCLQNQSGLLSISRGPCYF